MRWKVSGHMPIANWDVSGFPLAMPTFNRILLMVGTKYGDFKFERDENLQRNYRDQNQNAFV